MATLTITFDPAIPAPANGYRLKYRKKGSSDAFTTVTGAGSPIVVNSIAGFQDFEGTLESDCGAGGFSTPINWNTEQLNETCGGVPNGTTIYVGWHWRNEDSSALINYECTEITNNFDIGNIFADVEVYFYSNPARTIPLQVSNLVLNIGGVNVTVSGFFDTALTGVLKESITPFDAQGDCFPETTPSSIPDFQTNSCVLVTDIEEITPPCFSYTLTNNLGVTEPYTFIDCSGTPVNDTLADTATIDICARRGSVSTFIPFVENGLGTCGTI
jgi:hypothetical protein